MKVFTGLIVAASATVDRIETINGWIANPQAPHCGCQIIIDPYQYGGYINSTCTIRFPYADQNKYGRSEAGDPHFVSVASSYMVGRNRGPGPDGFKFTGFDEVSNPGVLDILVFYEAEDCAAPDRDISEAATLEQHEIWEIYNMTTEPLCEYVLTCEDYGEALPGVYLGNFNYDIARSVQTYTVPIYGLNKGETVTFPITDYYNEPNNCMNALAHAGHGTASGCSTNMQYYGANNSTTSTGSDDEECSNQLTFYHDQDHNGLLEYFQFEPVSPVNNPVCFEKPLHHLDDYKWQTPSPWDTQENYQPTYQDPALNLVY